MALIKSVKGKSPIFGKKVFLSENAHIVREFEMRKNYII